MQMTGIEAYEGRWEDNIVPTIGAAYRITTTSDLVEGLHQDIWFTFKSAYSFEGSLYQGDVIESGPAIGVPHTERIIVFKIKDIMPINNILVSFAESEYPQELDNEFKELLEGCSWFGNKLIIKKKATDTYDLSIDYYGNVTRLLTTGHEDKMYAWLTYTGFDLHICYYGKYVLPDWLKSLIDHPEENAWVKYYDTDKEW